MADFIDETYPALRRTDRPGITPPRPVETRGRPSCGDPEAFAALYRAGEAVPAIAAAFGCCRDTVINKLHAAGVELRPRSLSTASRKNAARDASIRARYASGEPAPAIAGDVGLNPVYIYQILKGVPKPSRKGFHRKPGSVVDLRV